jgi:Xaa-Pro aminopeptidase
MVFTAPSNFSLFKQRRLRLITAIKEKYGVNKGVIVLTADFEMDRYAFRQESSFYYFTGISEPAVVLCLSLDGREVLYTPRFATARAQWVQPAISGPADAAAYGVERIGYLGAEVPGYSFRPPFTVDKYESLVNDLKAVVAQQGKVFTLLDANNSAYFMQINLFEKLVTWVPGLSGSTVDCSPVVASMRREKDDYEIDLIYKAVQVTTIAHKTVASLIADSSYEYELQAAIESIFVQVAAATPAFPSIVATGKNTTILHHNQRHASLKPGDLVVIDIGAEYGFYAADLTRTYPVNGKFSARQLEIYQAVLDTQAYVESMAMPGMYLKNAKFPEKSLHHLAVGFLERKGLAQYFCHGIGHLLGLDVHDVGDAQTPLMPGDVFTIEPGVYLQSENLGVRIEDDYVMADDGAVCLSYDLPKQPGEIERLMRKDASEAAAL